MSLASVFKSFGHAIASGAKYFEQGIVDAVKVAQKVETLEPQAVAVIAAVAGPQVASISDTAFRILGDFATALKNANDDTLQAIAEKGLLVKTDVTAIQDVKGLYQTIEKMLAARGTPAPTA